MSRCKKCGKPFGGREAPNGLYETMQCLGCWRREAEAMLEENARPGVLEAKRRRAAVLVVVHSWSRVCLPPRPHSPWLCPLFAC